MVHLTMDDVFKWEEHSILSTSQMRKLNEWQSRAMNSCLFHFSEDYASNLMIQNHHFPIARVNYFTLLSSHFPLKTFSCRK